MKIISAIACLCICQSIIAQAPATGAANQPLASKVYTLADAPKEAGSINNKNIFEGSGAILSYHHMTLVSLPKKSSSNFVGGIVETFVIIKKGPAKITLNEKTVSVDRGSVMFLLPGDKAKIENDGSGEVEYYQMNSIGSSNPERGKKGGESFVMDWKDMVFKPHDKGGVRQLFDRQTTMMNRFDIHVTQLNEGFNSHPPHTHKNEEIILMLDGNAEMQIGTEKQKANAGDVVLLGSNVPHNLTNVGKTACLYFAIQWN